MEHGTRRGNVGQWHGLHRIFWSLQHLVGTHTRKALAVISLLSNIIHTVGTGDGIIKSAKEIRDCSSGTTLENERLHRAICS